MHPKLIATAATVAAGLATFTTSAQAVSLFGVDAVQNNLLSIDPDTGQATIICSVGFLAVVGIAFAPDGTLYGVDANTDQLVRLDPTTGAGTAVGSLGFGNVEGLSFAPDGTLYATDTAVDQLLTIDLITGAASAVGALGQPEIRGLAFLDADTLFGVDLSFGPVSIDIDTGEASIIGPLGYVGPEGFGGVVNLTLASTGIFFAIDDATDQLVIIDPPVSAASAVGPVGFNGVRGLAATDRTFGEVPLPPALALLLSGIAGLALVTGKRRSQRTNAICSG